MSSKLDLRRVESALKRAAQVSVSGREDERAGRFVGRNADTGRFIEKPSLAKTASRPKSK